MTSSYRRFRSQSFRDIRRPPVAGDDRADDPVVAMKVSTGGRLNAINMLRVLSDSLSGVADADADGDGSRGGAEAALAGRTDVIAIL